MSSRKIVDYYLASDEDGSFLEDVKLYIEMGYQPFGSIFITSKDYYYQPMVKYEEESSSQKTEKVGDYYCRKCRGFLLAKATTDRVCCCNSSPTKDEVIDDMGRLCFLEANNFSLACIPHCSAPKCERYGYAVLGSAFIDGPFDGLASETIREAIDKAINMANL